MKSKMYEFCRRTTVPCGFADSEGEIKTNAEMADLLGLNIDTPEMVALLEKIHTEKLPFSLVCNLPFDYNKLSKVWQFHFLPLFGWAGVLNNFKQKRFCS
ncbi:hypothetical protein [Candidatus Arsenophonus triatominarum]|uniref:hypothetical protein n=1 Tax=Candidatus Arsenophonus triatominarum TaxID=57911 RepID=UPI0007C5AF3C|nr:hypothetical protein [Candidatus Arsenophonus triatominarum]